MAGPFLTAAWRDLVMLNYEIDAAVLAPYVPRGCELDPWQGRHFASVVGFMFLRTRLLGVPIPWHRDFEEINLRFYVRRYEGSELRRGVVFIKEVVSRWAVATVARWAYNENYVCCPTAATVVPCGAASPVGSVSYRWKSVAGWNEVTAERRGQPAAPLRDSEEAFITEHYWGYSRQRDGVTVEYEVRHPPWRVWRATASRLQLDARGFYGDGFAAAFSQTPTSAFVAEGSDVEVMRGRRLPA
jgi:uncharacterized protein YqjF (DUF2071 family)